MRGHGRFVEIGVFAQSLGHGLPAVELGAAARNFLGRDAVRILIVELPVGACAPHERRLYSRAGGRRSLKHGKGKLQRCSLRAGIVGSTRGIAKRKVRKQKTRHADKLDNVLGAAHHNSGDAIRLQCAGGKADALMAYRAIGYKDRRVDCVAAAARYDFRAVDIKSGSMAAIGWQPVKTRCYRPDPTALCREAHFR